MYQDIPCNRYNQGAYVSDNQLYIYMLYIIQTYI